MMKISVVVSAYNEEKNIEECLKSVKKIADEIIVIDSSSIDKTTSVAEKNGAKVYKQPNHLMLNINKNYGFEKARNEWILNLDADERLTEELSDEIERILENDSFQSVVGYWIPRKNIMFGKWIKSEMWWPDYQLRLFKKASGKFPEKHVHEYIELIGEKGHLKNPILHYNYSSISQYLKKLDVIYTENEAKNLEEKGYKFNSFDVLLFPVRDFLKTFFAQKGYRDGLHGLVLSILQGMYTFVVYVKIWEKEGFRQDQNENFLLSFKKHSENLAHEFYYWLLSSGIETQKNPLTKTVMKLARKAHSRNVNK